MSEHERRIIAPLASVDSCSGAEQAASSRPTVTLCGRLGGRPEPVGEATVWEHGIENPKLAVAHVPEAVTRSYRYGHPRSGACPDQVLSQV
jgi:hypothetical protein